MKIHAASAPAGFSCARLNKSVVVIEVPANIHVDRQPMEHRAIASMSMVVSDFRDLVMVGGQRSVN